MKKTFPKKLLATVLPLSLSTLGCAGVDTAGVDGEPLEDEVTAETSEALSAPSVLASLNTCDGVGPRFVVSSNEKLVLDPGDGSQRFRADDLMRRRDCIVAAQFNVPSGFRARLGIAVGAGRVTLAANQTAGFAVQTGFTSRRPLTANDLLAGPTMSDVQGNGFIRESGRLDVQVDRRDFGHEDIVTSCGERGVWFYVKPATTASSPQTTDIDLDLVLGSIKLERCGG